MQAISEQVRASARASNLEFLDVSHVDNPEAVGHNLRACHGCDADIALKMGGDLSLIGVISKAGNTEYYASVQLSDAKAHTVLFRKTAFFIGSEESWHTGAMELAREAFAHVPAQ